MATHAQIVRVQILRMSRVLADASATRFVLMLWLARLADIHRAGCADSPDLPTLAKSHFWEKCDSPRQIRASLANLARVAIPYLRPFFWCSLETCQSRSWFLWIGHLYIMWHFLPTVKTLLLLCDISSHFPSPLNPPCVMWKRLLLYLVISKFIKGKIQNDETFAAATANHF